MDPSPAGRRLREEAESHPLKLPVRRRVDERHHAVSDDGLGVWLTLQVSPHSRIYDAVFERSDRRPTDAEVGAWLAAMLPDRESEEAPGPPGAFTRRFEAFDRRPELEAPIA